MLKGKTCGSILSPRIFGAISGPCIGPEMAPKLRGENIDTQVLPLSVWVYLHHSIAFPWAETIRIGTGKWSDTQVKKFKILSVELSWISYNFLFGWKWCQMSSETQVTRKWKYSKLSFWVDSWKFGTALEWQGQDMGPICTKSWSDTQVKKFK